MPVILAIWELETGRIKLLDQPKQKVSKTPAQENKPGVVVCTYAPSYLGGTDRKTVV
jgi:hypothetical protein